MERIRTIVKEVNNTVNQGKKIFFCVDDVCKVVGVSKKEWNECYVFYWGSIESFQEEYKEFFKQNYYTEVIQGANTSYEILYCTIDLFKEILLFDDFMKLRGLLQTFFDDDDWII